MKNYRAIYEEIERNTAAIEATKAEIDKLSFTAERATLRADKGSIDAFRAIRAKAEQNAGKIAELTEKIYILKVENLILSDNMKAAIVSEALPVIRAAFEKHNGKQYGPKTAAAIKEEIKNAGFFAIISGNGRDLIINVVNPENMCNDYRYPTVTLYSSYDVRFLTPENRINFSAVETEPPLYIDGTKARAAAVIAAYNNYYAAREAADKARAELNNIMPGGRYYNGNETLYKTIF